MKQNWWELTLEVFRTAAKTSDQVIKLSKVIHILVISMLETNLLSKCELDGIFFI